MERQLNVFICHASENKPIVRELERRLREDGFDPWLDENKLVPGQNWSMEIDKAVRHSDAIIVCISRTSVTKEGYLQREIRRVLEVAEEKPEGSLFVFPVKLEECEVPDRFARWHWAAYYEVSGYDRLVTALRMRAVSLGVSPSAKDSAADVEPGSPVSEALKRYRSKEYDAARSLFLCAAEDGSVDAMRYLAELYDLGKGVKQDLSAALSWYRAAAEAGDAIGMIETGRRLAVGRGVTRDKQGAFRWYFKAAEAGSAAGMTAVGIAYRRGVGVDRNDAQALHWLQKAAEAGHAEAMAELGAMYADGIGVASDDAIAVQWFQKAIENGAINGVRYLATMHAQGRGVPKDDRIAFRLLRKAADAGDTPAMVLLGRKYLERDTLEAKRLYEQAASAGDVEGMRELADLYAHGIGVQKDEAVVTELLEKAAANDDVESMRTLGKRCEERGWPLGSIRWYRQAAALRDEFSVARLKTLAGANPAFELVHTFVHTYKLGRVQDITLSADGRFAVFCGMYAEQAPSLWDARVWKELRRITTRKDVNCTAFSPTGHTLGLFYHYGVRAEDPVGANVGLLDLANDELILSCNTPGWYCHRLWFWGENLMVLQSDPQANDFLYEVSQLRGTPTELFSGHDVLSITRDALLIAIRAENRSLIEVRERATGKIRTTLRAPVSLGHALSFDPRGAFSEDGRLFAAQDEESVRIWDSSSGQPILVIPEKGQLTFSPDGSLLAIDPGHSVLRLWDTRTGELRQTIAEEDFVEAFAFRPDGKLLVTAHDSRTVRVWEAR